MINGDGDISFAEGRRAFLAGVAYTPLKIA